MATGSAFCGSRPYHPMFPCPKASISSRCLRTNDRAAAGSCRNSRPITVPRFVSAKYEFADVPAASCRSELPRKFRILPGGGGQERMRYPNLMARHGQVFRNRLSSRPSDESIQIAFLPDRHQSEQSITTLRGGHLRLEGLRKPHKFQLSHFPLPRDVVRYHRGSTSSRNR